jgi:hypothetical protein
MSKRGSVKIYFWPVKKRGSIIEKRIAWAGGILALESNEFHETRSDAKIFNSLEEFFIRLHELLNENEVSLIMASEKDERVQRLGKGYPLKAGPWRS